MTLFIRNAQKRQTYTYRKISGCWALEWEWAVTLHRHEESYWGETVLTLDYSNGIEAPFLMWENKMSSAQEVCCKLQNAMLNAFRGVWVCVCVCACARACTKDNRKDPDHHGIIITLSYSPLWFLLYHHNMTQSSKEGKTHPWFSKSLKRNPHEQSQGPKSRWHWSRGRVGVVSRHEAHAPAVNTDVTPAMSEGLALEPQEDRPRVRPQPTQPQLPVHPVSTHLRFSTVAIIGSTWRGLWSQMAGPHHNF